MPRMRPLLPASEMTGLGDRADEGSSETGSAVVRLDMIPKCCGAALTKDESAAFEPRRPRNGPLVAPDLIAAVHHQHLAGDESARWAGEVTDRIGDVAHIAEALHQVGFGQRPAGLLGINLHPLGCDGAGRHAVD